MANGHVVRVADDLDLAVRIIGQDETDPAFKALSVVRVRYVVHNLDGSQLTDGQTTHAIRRIIRRAGLGERGWHSLRHSFGTHAALFGVNPWTLMRWMGHKRIDETMLYVNLADNHRRELDRRLLEAGAKEQDPDRRILPMLGCRGTLVAPDNGAISEITEIAV